MTLDYMINHWQYVREDKYLIFANGQIYDLDEHRFLHSIILPNGYEQLSRRIYGTQFVHRIVATAFLDNPNNLKEVNHIDENKSNNHIDNLEWCSPKANRNYGTRNQRISRSLKELWKMKKK